MHEPASPTPVRRRGRPIGNSRQRAALSPENLHERLAQAVVAAIGLPSEASPGVALASLVLQIWARGTHGEIGRLPQTNLVEAVTACLHREARELEGPDRVAIRAAMLAKHLPALIEALSHARPADDQPPDAAAFVEGATA